MTELGREPKRKVHKVEEVTVTKEVDFHDHDGVVSGDVTQGGVIRGDGNLLICGEVTGAPNHPCLIEVAGQAILERSVCHAKIKAREVVASGDVDKSSLRLDLGATVKGSLLESEVCLGTHSADLARLRRFRADQQNVKEEIEALSQTNSLAARKFIKTYRQVDMSFGGILKPGKRELVVDLTTFYKAVKGKPFEEVDKALEEFILRVLVGGLTRNNKHYISRNPSRHKVFLRLIEEIRKHLLSVRNLDKLKEDLEEVSKRRDELVMVLNRPARATLRVEGEVGEDVRVQLLQLQGFKISSSGNVETDESWTAARTFQAEASIAMEITDLNGEKRVDQIGQMSDGTFGMDESGIVWRPAR